MLGLAECNFGLGLYCGRFCVFVFDIWLFVIVYAVWWFLAVVLVVLGWSYGWWLRCSLVDLVLWFSGML